VLHTLRFQEDIKSLDALSLPPEGARRVSNKELRMAEQLVDSLTTHWEPQKYHDTYTEDLLRLIRYKASHGDRAPVRMPSVKKSVVEGAKVVDMMGLLKRSLDHAEKTKDIRSVRRKNAKKAESSRTRHLQ